MVNCAGLIQLSAVFLRNSGKIEMMLSRIAVFGLIVATGLPAIEASDWLRFRGPNGSGISADAQPAPTRWSPRQNIKWKTELSGAGVSSPIVVGDRIFVSCYSGYGMDRANPGEMKNLKRHLLCFNADTGEKIWEATVDAVQPEDPFSGAGVPAHGYASHTPVSDGKNIYVFFGKSGALAFDMDGNQLWQTRVGTESDPNRWGSASSPVLYNDTLIVTASAESQALVGLDKKTGKEIWRQEAAGMDGLWGTPALVEVGDGRQELVLSVAGEVWGINPENGKLRWYCKAAESDQASTSAVIEDETVFAVGGRGGGSIAVRAGGKGDVTESHVNWTGRNSSRFASPVAYEGQLLLVADNILHGINARNGESVFQVRLEGVRTSGSSGGRGGFGSLDYASPVMSGRKLYYLKGNGQMFVFQLGENIEQIAVNQFTDDQESFGGTPALSDGRLFARSNKHLYCVVNGPFDESQEPEPAAVDADEPQQRGGGRGGEGRRRFDPAAFFDRMDEDKDGSLSAAELTGPLQDRGEQLDTNKDGSVSREEFQANIRNLFSRGARGGRGGGREDNRPDRPTRPEFDQGIGDD